MNRHYLYQRTDGGTCICIKPDQMAAYSGVGVEGEASQLLGVVSTEPGIFEVKATGEIPAAHNFLLLPIKGSQQLSLLMEVHEVASLITPEQSWSARCSGLTNSEFQLRSLDAHCDGCGADESIEFLQLTEDVQQDAINGLSLYGWQANAERQLCKVCSGEFNER